MKRKRGRRTVVLFFARCWCLCAFYGALLFSATSDAYKDAFLRSLWERKCFHLCERLTRAETLDEEDFLRRLNDDDGEENTSARFEVQEGLFNAKNEAFDDAFISDETLNTHAETHDDLTDALDDDDLLRREHRF